MKRERHFLKNAIEQVEDMSQELYVQAMVSALGRGSGEANAVIEEDKARRRLLFGKLGRRLQQTVWCHKCSWRCDHFQEWWYAPTGRDEDEVILQQNPFEMWDSDDEESVVDVWPPTEWGVRVKPEWELMIGY